MSTKRRETKKEKPATGKRKTVSRPATRRAIRKLLTEPGNLPESYGETRVVLLSVDPYLVHVYWEVNPQEFKKTQRKLRKERAHAQTILRFFDITNIVFDGTNAHSFFDIPVDLKSGNWYVHLWSPEKSYFTELGLKTEDGRFFFIGRSNTTETPRAWPPPGEPEKRTLVPKAVAVHEAAPLLAGKLASHLIMEVPAEATAETKIRGGRKMKVTPVPATDILLRKVTELYRPQSIFKETFAPTLPQLQEPFHPRYGKEGDLTDMNEESFMPGISSDSVTSSEQR